MKTQYDLYHKYITETVPMAEAAGINPWECVRTNGVIFKDHPKFILEQQGYTFALTVLDETPVFPGDKLYGKSDGFCTEASVLEIDKLLLSEWSLKPPTKKRTFMLDGVELRSPIKDRHSYELRIVGFSEQHYNFSSSVDLRELEDVLYKLLTEARDKE